MEILINMSITKSFMRPSPQQTPDINSDVCGQIIGSLSIQEALNKRLINHDWQKAIDAEVSGLWDKVKKEMGSPQNATSGSIENLVQRASLESSPEASACALFKRLNYLFLKTYGIELDLNKELGSIPAQIQELHLEAQSMQDASLERIWNKISSQLSNAPLFPPLAPGENVAMQIRIWMNNPLNAPQLHAITHLEIRHSDLRVIPPEIALLTHLQVLDLSDNRISVIPKEIGALTQLKELSLFGNQITAIPKAIGALTQLQKLSLYKNQITAIPREIGALTQLSALVLHYNQIAVIPKEIEALIQLRDLNLHHNQIAVIPKEIEALIHLNQNCLFRGNTIMSYPMGILNRPSYQDREDIHNFSAALSYQCQSTPAKLCQAIMQGKMETKENTNKEEEMKEIEEIGMSVPAIFATLSSKEQEGICKHLRALAQWPESDAWRFSVFANEKFADKNLFIQAVRDAIVKHLKALPQDQKNQVYGEVYLLAGSPTVRDLQWGERHALDNLPRLADALERVSPKFSENGV
jgi:hypothetical protein